MDLLGYMLIGMGCALVLGIIMSRRKKKRMEREAKSRARPASEAANITNDITKVRTGGVLELPHFDGRRSGRFETYVKSRNRYSDGDSSWYELVCDFEGRDLLVEWEREGGDLFISAGFKDGNPNLDELGLSEDSLVEFDEAQDGGFSFDGVEYHFSESSERTCYEGDGRSGEGFYCWEFLNDDDSAGISVEKYEGDRHFYVSRFYTIDTDDVNVYDVGAS